MDDLLKDAIADAKAVRETALANAKLALEEAFTPRIQSMLSQKIQSEIEDEDEVADAEVADEEEEVPAEAPAEEAPAEEAPEVAVEPEEGEEVADIADEIEDEDEIAHEGEHEDEDEGYDESKVIEIDGVKYAPVVSEEEEDEDEGMYKEEEDEDEGYSEDLDLEAVLAELEGETVTEEEDEEDKDEVKEEEDKEDEDEISENDVSSEIGAADNKLKPEAGDSTKIGQGPEGEGSDKPAGKEDENSEIVDDLKEDVEVSEDIDLEEVLKALTEEEDEEDDKKDEAVAESVNEVKTLKADLEEHRNVVKYLRGKLNEVNLLNAKLLFTNKLFRNFGLNNEQKLKVVETFDRATNLREVKLVFSTLAESFGNKVASKPSKPIKESKGSSSKPVASTKPKTEEVISEGFDMKARFQKLAKIL